VPQRNPSAGIPTSELDGTPGTDIGPALSKPYHERIRAARSYKKQPEPAQDPMPPQQDQAAIDMSERLKRFLAIPSIPRDEPPAQEPPVFLPEPADAPPHPFVSGAHPPRSADFLPAFSAENRHPPTNAMPHPFSSGTHPVLAPSAPAAMASTTNGGGNGRSPDILNMEDSLRRILKLDLSAPPPMNYQSS
jgi:hypothetical protein